MGSIVAVVLPLALAFIMFALGLGLTFADFARVAKQPRDVVLGFLCQVLLLPAVAFALVSLWPMAPELALGVMIIAAAPGGVTSNILTAFGRGDVALSITLTAIVSLVSVVTVPLIVAFSHVHLAPDGAAAGSVPIAGMALRLFALVTLPVLVGLALRHLAASFATRFEPLARRISVALFVLVLLGAIWQERGHIVEYFAQAGAVTLALNLAMMALAWSIARRLASGPRQRIAIALECGLQNGTLAIAVATLTFGGGLTLVPASTYSLIMFATALLYVALLRRTAAA